MAHSRLTVGRFLPSLLTPGTVAADCAAVRAVRASHLNETRRIGVESRVRANSFNALRELPDVPNRRAELLLSCLILPLLAACHSTPRCVDPAEPYLHAANNNSLKVPTGLTKPDNSSALAIPDKAIGDKVDAAGKAPRIGACLEDPPSYFRSAGTVARSPEEVVASWAQAWSSRDADAVIALYSSSFKAPTDSAGSAEWLTQRKEQVATGPVPTAMIEGLKVDQERGDRRVATFIQRFGTNTLRKELTLIRESGSWRIVEEKVVDVK